MPKMIFDRILGRFRNEQEAGDLNMQFSNMIADTLANLNSKISDDTLLGLAGAPTVDPRGTDAERGSALETAISNATSGETIYLLGGRNYEMSNDAVLGGTDNNPNLIVLGAEEGFYAHLTGKSVIVDTTGVCLGLDGTSASNSEGFKDGSIPVKFSQSSGSATKAGTISHCKSGDYSTPLNAWNGKTCAYTFNHSIIGAIFCYGGTMTGDVNNCSVGNDFCGGGAFNGNSYNNSFEQNFCYSGTDNGTHKFSIFSETSGTVIEKGGTHVNCVDFDNKIFTTTYQYKLKLYNETTFKHLSSDPPDPASGESVTWFSDGTGSGNAGDYMMKSNVGGTVTTTTIATA